MKQGRALLQDFALEKPPGTEAVFVSTDTPIRVPEARARCRIC